MRNDKYKVYDVVTNEELKIHVNPLKDEIKNINIREDVLDIILDFLDTEKAPAK